MKKISSTIIFLCAIFTSIPSIQAQDCNCADAFEATIEIYKKNYSLFRYKVTEENFAVYTAFINVMREKAQQAENPKDCKQVLEQYLDFFRDGHNSISLSIKDNQEFERLQISEEQFKTDYKKWGYTEDEIPGLWKWGEYTVAILPAPPAGSRKRDFVGVLLESSNKAWKVGDVLLELTKGHEEELEVSFFMPDHTEMIMTGKKINAGQLNLTGSKDWEKIWPVVEIDQDRMLYNTFHIRMIDDVPYIRFPSFNLDPQEVKNVISANHHLLVNAEFIVVDVRDNEGGSDYAYFPILPYVLSGPVQIPHVGMWMSEDNLQPYLEERGGKNKKPENRTPEQKDFYDFAMSIKDSLFYQTPNEYAYTFEADTIYKNPKKVAILMNENSASSAETFIFRTKQSDRTIFYGQNSAGVVDGFMVFSKYIDCFKLSYPHAIRAKDVAENPIDPYGLEPDVYLDKKVDALDFSIKHMKFLLKNQETNLHNSSN